MALDSFTNLKASLAKWLWRTGETDTETYIPDMIAMAEAHFNRVLKCREMVATDSALVVTDGVATLPGGFRAMLSIRETAYNHDRIKPKPIDDIERFDDISTGCLQFYAIVGSEIHFWPRTSSTVRMRYRKSLDALTDANTSNWLLEAHPDIYLYQCCISGEAFNLNDQRVAMWKAKVAEAINDLNEQQVLENEDALAMSPSGGIAV